MQVMDTVWGKCEGLGGEVLRSSLHGFIMTVCVGGSSYHGRLPWPRQALLVLPPLHPLAHTYANSWWSALRTPGPARGGPRWTSR